jgi:hypothetical protein
MSWNGEMFFKAFDVKRNERPKMVDTPIPEINAEMGMFIFSSNDVIE